MNTRTITLLAQAAFAAALFAQSAEASSILGITELSSPEVSGEFDMTNFFGFFGSGVASNSSALTAFDGSLSVSMTSDVASDLSFTSGALSVTDDDGAWLSGNLANVATVSDPAGEDTVEMLFDGLSGPAAAEFGNFAIATLTGEFGASPFGPGSPMSTFGVSGEFQINAAMATPIPTPAALPLLVAGLGVVATIGRSKKRFVLPVKTFT